MKAVPFALRSFLRDLRAGELSILLASVVVAVTAMTAVGFFTDRVGAAMKAQASEVLAADLVIRSPSVIQDDFLDRAEARGLRTAELLSFPTAVLAGEQSALASVDAVSEGYPLRGEVLVSSTLFGRTAPAGGIPARGEAWAEPGLLARLGADVGVTIRLGEVSLRITRSLAFKPDQNIGFVNLAPGLLMNLADIPASGVIKPGSRVTWHQMYAGEERAVTDFRAELAPLLDRDQALRGREDAGEQITAAIDRAQRFLSLASLITVILAAVAAAMAARRYAGRHLDSIALLKTLGATQRAVSGVMLAELVVIIVVSTAIGLAAGWLAQYGLAALARDFIGFELPGVGGRPFLLGIVTALTVVIGFAMPHLLLLSATPPIRVLRRDLPPPRLGTGVAYGSAVLALFVMITVIVRDLLLVGLIAAGLAATALLATGLGLLLVRSLARFRGAAGVAWRYGLANVARRRGESVVQIVAFGLSLMVLLLLGVVRADLLEAWQLSIPEDAPNQFMINIEPGQMPELNRFFADELGREPHALPLIRGRIVRVGEVPADEYDFPSPRGASFVQREANVTWAARLPDSNEVVAGRWWDENHRGAPELSLTDEVAEQMGVGLGDRLSFSVGGEEIEATVTSLRRVDWDSFQPNFFLILSPGVVEDLPQTWLASIYIPQDRLPLLAELVREFPGVTVLDLDIVLAQVRSVIERASLAVQYVFLFTLLAGVVVMLAAIQLTRDERRFESAILHTLGAARRKILQGVATEFLTLGGLAGLLAAVGAGAAGWALAHYAFELEYRADPWILPLGLAAGALIVGVTGTFATRRAVSEPPVAVLREG